MVMLIQRCHKFTSSDSDKMAQIIQLLVPSGAVCILILASAPIRLSLCEVTGGRIVVVEMLNSSCIAHVVCRVFV
jgi:hypothetical protein